MASVEGVKGRWVNSKHRLLYCGPSTGHAVQTLAMCENTTTAELLLHALAFVKAFHDADPGKESAAAEILERAGLL